MPRTKNSKTLTVAEWVNIKIKTEDMDPDFKQIARESGRSISTVKKVGNSVSYSDYKQDFVPSTCSCHHNLADSTQNGVARKTVSQPQTSESLPELSLLEKWFPTFFSWIART